MDPDLPLRIANHLSQTMGTAVVVQSVSPISGGACQDNLKVTLTVDGTECIVVLRSDAPSGLPGSIDRRTEAQVIGAAADAGVPTPRARHGCDGLVRPDAHAWFMDWVDGVVLGGKVARAPALETARTRLPEQLAAALSAIHRVPADGALPLRGADGDPVRFAIDEVAAMVDRLPCTRPAQRLAVEWLRRHAPPPTGHTLVHRDFRLGNLMVDPNDGLVAVLDWEFARYGDPAEDLGWFCVRDWRFGALHRGGGGVCSRETFRQAYCAASGRTVSAETLRFWEVLGNVRWAASAILQGQRARTGGKDGAGVDVELLSIPRRAVEMEWEALRLIRQANTLPAPAVSGRDTAGTVLMGDGTPPAELVQAAVDWLGASVVPALSQTDRKTAYQARVVAWLLGGVVKELEADAAPAELPSAPTDPPSMDRICAALRTELTLVQPRFATGEDAAE